MKCTIHFYLLNEHFSKEHADANYNGEESELNRKYEWEDELNITTDVDSIEVLEDVIYPLSGETDDGPFSYDVNAMNLFEINSNDGTKTYVGCSKSIMDSFEITEDGQMILKVYLKDYEPMSNPLPGIYIAAQEFPKELIEHA
ncbi:MAG: hypothetical protein MK105_09135 [Crocinitomicaceae bacterium]|nr:hypothetical protein [Crocinitomicaceae bacterium]